jgi:non-ribosomal peptide synthetase component E (peptide arylation enzyme)
MSNYKVPRQVVIVDTLPANVNGKVDEQALRGRTPRTLLSPPGR